MTTARKVMLLGEIGVGKTSLIRRLTLDRFDFNYKPTLGVDIYTYDIPETVFGERMTLIVWDTDGNLGESVFRHIYMREAAAALIIGDATRRETIDLMSTLGDGFREHFPGRCHRFVINKSDLLPSGSAPPLNEDLSGRNDELTITSAKTGDNVTNAFHSLGSAIWRRGQ